MIIAACLPRFVSAQDSTHYAMSDSAAEIPVIQSVYDIHWVTHSIRSGWEKGDTVMTGLGLEECDTVHPFIPPVTGRFLRGYTYYHDGWDIGLASGEPIVAGLSGKVRYAKYCSGYGNLVIVRHYSGLEVYYAHLSKFKVTVDQWVEAGDTIGLVGATGRARGPHLHLEFRLCDRSFDVGEIYTLNDTVINLYKIKDITARQHLPPTVEYYAVKKGDTLSGIARRYGTSVSKLTGLNNISASSILRIGQRIRVR